MFKATAPLNANYANLHPSSTHVLRRNGRLRLREGRWVAWRFLCCVGVMILFVVGERARRDRVNRGGREGEERDRGRII